MVDLYTTKQVPEDIYYDTYSSIDRNIWRSCDDINL